MRIHSPSTDYSNCLEAFMKDIQSDLDQDMTDKSSKYSYDFYEDNPIDGGDIKWSDISEIQKSEIQKKPRIGLHERNSTAANTTFISSY